MTDRTPDPEDLPWTSGADDGAGTEPTQPLHRRPGADWVPPSVPAAPPPDPSAGPWPGQVPPRHAGPVAGGPPAPTSYPSPSTPAAAPHGGAFPSTPQPAAAQPGQASPPPPPTAPYGAGPATWPLHPGPVAGYPMARPGMGPGPAPGRLPGWLWPVVASVALLVGLLGGAAGGAAYERLRSERDPAASSGPAPLPADNGSVAAVAQQVLPSTVQILAFVEGEDGGASGSGFVLDRDGHVVTNNHVVADASGEDGRIQIIDHRGNRFDATLVGRSPVYDLAVLSAPELEGLKPASLGSAERLRVGEAVVAIGSPLGLTSTVTAGIVSAVHRPVTTGSSTDETSYINAVQTDAAINPGNSGGPLVNLSGQVVGVNSAIATTGTIAGEAGNIGVGFAIPIDQVRVTAEQILDNGEARYPVIGATLQTAETEIDGDEGATIDEVLDDSPAERAGLREDDVVTAIDGQRVSDGIALIVAIRAHQPGETIDLTVTREGRESTFRVTLDSKVG